MGRSVIQFLPKCITRTLAGNLPFGESSWVQNLRAKGRALVQRGGQAYLHGTADGSNYVVSEFQFSKGKQDESHFYAQMSDGDVLEKTSALPTVETAAVFGAEVFSGSTGQVPASWSVIDDMLIYTNGVDLPQVYCGDGSAVDSCIVYDSLDTEPPDMPIEDTKDYSLEAADSDTSRIVVLDSLHGWNVAADEEYGAIYVKTKTPHVKALNFVVGKANGTACTATFQKWNGAWVTVPITDGTADGGASIAKTGAMAFTTPTDVIPKFMFGENGFWWRVYFSADLDAEVEVTSITFDSIWGAIQNIWDGVPVNVVEVQFFDESTAADAYKTFSFDYVKVGEATLSDKIYFATTHKIEAFYVDVGETPNENAATIHGFGKWTGAAWSEAAPTVDGAQGLSKSGWVYVGKQDTAEPVQFQNYKNYLYWWYFTVNTTLSGENTDISIQYQPYFDIKDLGTAGRVCHVWKERLMLWFDKWPKDGYVAGKNMPMCFNGDDSTVLQAGDGRANAVTAVASWANEILVWQEEKGVDGGCVTLFQGNNAPTFGKRILSSKLGTASPLTMCVVEGALSSLNSVLPVAKLAYFESRMGVFATDGQGFSGMSDDIQNYWDPEETEYIRRSYSARHFMGHDSSSNVLLMGIVSGTSATAPNVFPVFHLNTNTWTFDDREQPITCFCEAAAATGDVGMIQTAGMIGYVLRLNTGSNDVTAAIDAHTIVELDWWGIRQILERVYARFNVTTGDCTMTPYENGVAQDAHTLSMTAEKSSELVRRHLLNIKHTDEHLSLKFANAVASQTLSMVDLVIEAKEVKE